MIILHTSDWHLGQSLHGQRRTEAFAAFLDWLLDALRAERVDALIIAGDIFDTMAPSHRAQELYYRFLARVSETPCRHVVVIAGNHDSPSFLDAARPVLEALDVRVIGAVPRRSLPSDACASAREGSDGALEDIAYEEEVLVLRDGEGHPELLVCAVPYLKERDVRRALADDAPGARASQVLDGIREHYRRVCAIAEETRRRLGEELPIVATGHLFAAGAQAAGDDGERDLYVGSLLRVEAAATFPPAIDYLALGHLHAPQLVGDNPAWRYSGAPLPMGFDEADRAKSVCLVAFEGRRATVRLLDVPVFQELRRLRGSWGDIERAVRELAAEGSSAWLEITHVSETPLGDLADRVEHLLKGTRLRALSLRDQKIAAGALSSAGVEGVSLADLDAFQVFERFLEAKCSTPPWTDADRQALRQTYSEAVAALDSEDAAAE